MPYPPPVTVWFGRYRICYRAFPKYTNYPVVEIGCYVDNNDLSDPEGNHVGGIRFWEKERLPAVRAVHILPNSPIPWDRVLLNFPIERLQPVLHTMAHDDPLYLFYAEGSLGRVGWLGSGSEQLGAFDWENLDL